jgi:signal transduction histidine kinase
MDMQIEVYFIGAINMLGVFLSCFYIFGKAINSRATVMPRVYTVLWCLLAASVYAFLPERISLSPVLLIFCLISIFFIRLFSQIKLDCVVSAFLLSFALSYSFLITSVLFISLILIPFSRNGLHSGVLVAILAAILQFYLSYLFFKIRRFRDGFPYLFDRGAVFFALIAACVVLVLISWLSISEQAQLIVFCINILAVGACIILWFATGINTFYKKTVSKNSIELLEREIAESNRINQRLLGQIDAYKATQIATHKLTQRLAAMEHIVSNNLSSSDNIEVSDEISYTLDDIRRLKQDFDNDIKRIKSKKFLPSTQIRMIDILFDYYYELCIENEIYFNLKINCSIPDMLEHTVSQSGLETIIGDIMQNAIAAVNSPACTYRSILAVLGQTEGSYELSVSDSGISFEVDTLTRLGNERVTTHAESGGSGIGFITIFDTMRKYGASLIISEKDATSTGFSKSVTIRFDGNEQYIIETYRPEVFSRLAQRNGVQVRSSHA